MYVAKTKQFRDENDWDRASLCITHVQLLSFVYAELVIANKEGIPYFEKFIHVTSARHVAFLVGSKLASRTLRLLAFRWIMGLGVSQLKESIHLIPKWRPINYYFVCMLISPLRLVNIHLIPKWRPINYSFVCMFISPLCLIFTSKFFCIFYMLTRHQGLINMQTKE